MDLKRLKYFVTVAQLGSFTRAAEVLGMAQPPLSQRIQELETEVGSILIDRGCRPLRLTKSGQLLYDQSVHILQRTETMMSAMRRLQAESQPTFTLGLVPTNFHGNFARALREYRSLLPDVEVRIREMNSVEQVDALLEGKIDAGISRIEIVAPGVRRILLHEEPMVVALPFDHPLATCEEAISMEALKDEPFIVYASHPRPSLADHVLNHFAERGISLSRVVEVGVYETALIMIAAGEGLSVVPASARLVALSGVTYRPLVEHITSPVMLCHRDGNETPELQTFSLVLEDFFSRRRTVT